MQAKSKKPSIYTPELCARICKKIRAGKTILDISKLKEFPCRAIMYRWRVDKPEFDKALFEAEKCREQYWMDENKRLSRIEKSELEITDGTGRVVINSAWVNARDLAIKTNNHLLGISNPRKHKLNAQKFDFPVNGTPEQQINALFSAASNGQLAISEIPALMSAINVKQNVITIEQLTQRVDELLKTVEEERNKHGQR